MRTSRAKKVRVPRAKKYELLAPKSCGGKLWTKDMEESKGQRKRKGRREKSKEVVVIFQTEIVHL